MGHVSIIETRAGKTILYIIAAPKVGKRESGKVGNFPVVFPPVVGNGGKKVVGSQSKTAEGGSERKKQSKQRWELQMLMSAKERWLIR